MTNPRTEGDVITLASGERVVPAPMEVVIRSSNRVGDVVMFGQGRKQVGVLIEPSTSIDVNDGEAVANFRNQIWDKIEEANNLSSGGPFSRIIKETILITKNGEPMRRESGTVQPEATLEKYKDKINNLYDRPSSWTPEDIGQWLLQHARTIGENDEIDPLTDLFLQGFNSLKATSLRNKVSNALKHWLNPIQNDVPGSLIYQIPIIQNLSSWIATLANEGPNEAAGLFNGPQEKAIDDMIQKYSVASPRFSHVLDPIVPAVVLLTGSTGGLGSSLLLKLVESELVDRVFALNRPPVGSTEGRQKSVEERQTLAFKLKGLTPTNEGLKKITYIEADASQINCGLTPEQYSEIQSSVTLIIHNAWRVDFNLGLSSFEDCIKASKNLVELGATSARKHLLRFLFTSSIASASGWNNAEPLPEEFQRSSVAVGTGYGASKYVAERIITSSPLAATSFRIGQIAGTRKGYWGTSDWFPILVRTSQSLEKLPKVKGVVSWVDEEYVASAILDAAFATTQELPPVLNLVNPQSQRFDEVIGLVQEAAIEWRNMYARPGAVKWEFPTIESSEWLELLEREANLRNPNLDQFPAVKLFEFIQSVLTDMGSANADTAEVAGMKCKMDKMKRVSPTVEREFSAAQVTKRKAKQWAKKWAYWNE